MKLIKVLLFLSMIGCSSPQNPYPVTYFICATPNKLTCDAYAKFKTVTECLRITERFAWFCNQTANPITCTSRPGVIAYSYCE